MSNQLAEKKPAGIKQLISSDAMRNQFALALPKHLSLERFIRIAITATTKVPKLLECTPESVMRCLLDLSALGIEADGRRAHLIPYKNECTLIIDYKGIAELVMRSGLVSSIHADKVCDADDFEVDRGEIIRHRINYRASRGKAYAYYVIIKFKDGSEKSEVMSTDEVESIRKRSKSGNNGPWVTDFDEMGKKTVFRRASKWLPLSPEIRDALEKDSDVDADNTRITTGRVVGGNPMGVLEPTSREEPRSEMLAADSASEPSANDSRREEMMGDIRAMLAEEDSTLAKFTVLCRNVGLLGDGVSLQDAPDDLRQAIHEERYAILRGEYSRA
jgi:recombination protein RecT